MAIPSTGPISLLDLQTEFGGVSPISIDEYYRGGAYVNSSTAAGTGSSQTAPLTPTSPVQIPTAGNPIQFSQFRGTQAVIIGNSGYLVPPTDSLSISDLQTFTLPAGVRYIRAFLVGGGGGGGGQEQLGGGNGGGGSVVSGTIDTSVFGATNIDRTIYLLIGRGGKGGYSLKSGDSVNYPHPAGGHTFGLNEASSSNSTGAGTWSAWMNTYAVRWYQNYNSYVTSSTGMITNRTIYFPSTGTYQFQFLSDNTLEISVDGVLSAGTTSTSLNDQLTTNAGSAALASPLTKSISITQGWHKLSFKLTNSAGPTGFAVRIMSGVTELWTTRYETNSNVVSNNYIPYATGGVGGYSGSAAASGYGGAGGSATIMAIEVAGSFKFVAAAGGGGGGGGAGAFSWVQNNKNANWMGNGYVVTATPSFAPGSDGEYCQDVLNGTGTVPSFYNNDGGGGGGGGGVVNPRNYFSFDPVIDWRHSGLGGRSARVTQDYNNAGDGGQNGLSAIYPGCTFADFAHANTTGMLPNFPANLQALSVYSSFQGATPSITTAGKGGTGSTNNSFPGTDGNNGAAYIDWGLTDNTVGATTVLRSSITGGSLILEGGFTNIYTHDVNGGAASSFTITIDAWGGGGNPSSDYTYSWSHVTTSGAPVVTLINQTTSRLTLQVTGVTVSGYSGYVQCTVSDGVNVFVTPARYWESTDTFGGGGGGA